MSYRRTIGACYAGIVCQAAIVNITALLFTALGEEFSLSYTQLGLLVLVNFTTQVLIALIFGNIVDRFGFRRFIVGAHFAAAIGMAVFAFTPYLPFEPYIMLIIGTLIFGAAGGFLEVLLSPIINAIPTDEKSSAMSIMHSFFCFGHVFVAIATTLFLMVFGRESWPIIIFIWLLLPLINGINFLSCPIENAAPIDKQSSVKQAIPLFILLVLMIVFAGASEITFSQWASAYMEETMELPKVIGDIAGVGMFALMMGLCRLGYGIITQKKPGLLPSQSRLMLVGTIIVFLSYVTLAATHNPILGLIACALCGLGVGLLWPGTLSLAVENFPTAGTWIFAIMAAGGNIGASAGPAIFGVIADFSTPRMGFMLTAVIPLVLFFILFIYIRAKKRSDSRAL